MKLEDDPSIATCACPHCGQRESLPCVPPMSSDSYGRRFVSSHMARLMKARGILVKRHTDRRLSKKNAEKVFDQLSAVLREITKRRRRWLGLSQLA